MKPLETAGFHHITMVSTSAPRTLAFYGELLGFDLVKKTVNFDDPSAYHLYFGREGGRPGTILTFFEWGDVPRGAPGVRVTIFSDARTPARVHRAWASESGGEVVKQRDAEDLPAEAKVLTVDWSPDGRWIVAAPIHDLTAVSAAACKGRPAHREPGDRGGTSIQGARGPAVRDMSVS